MGDSATVVITAETSQPGSFTNLAVVEVDGDVFPANNKDSADVAISEVLPLEILPETGADSDRVALVAGLLMLFGTSLVLGARRRRGGVFG